MNEEQQMSSGEAWEYRKLQLEMLKEALSVVLCDLRERDRSGETRDACTPLNNARGLLHSAIMAMHDNAVVILAKEACESLLDRASRAEREGGPDLAAVLRAHVDKLSPIVAEMLPGCDCEDKSKEGENNA